MAEGGAVRELLASFGFDVDTKELKKGETALGSFLERAKSVAEGLAAAFAVEQVYEWAESQVKAATQVERTAAALGITTEKVQELQYASKALGMDGDALLNMLGNLEVNQFKAAEGSKEQAHAFALLGVATRDSHGSLKNVAELLPDVAEGIKNVRDPAKAAALATELFGKQGRELLPFLKEGREGVEKYAAEFKELGGGFNDETIKQAREFEHQSAKLSLTWRALSSTILQGLLPVLQPLVGAVTKGVMLFRKWAEGSEIVKASMLVLGGVATVFAIQMAAANWPILAAAAAIGILVLLVDDLINLFEGNDSLVGRFLDSAFGKGTSTQVVEALRDLWKEISGIMQTAWQFIKAHSDEIAKILKVVTYPVTAVWKGAKMAGEGIGWVASKLGPEMARATSPLERQRLLGQGGGVGGSHVKEGDVHFHVAGDLSNEVHERAAKQWHEHRKRERRETAAALQRAPAGG